MLYTVEIFLFRAGCNKKNWASIRIKKNFVLTEKFEKCDNKTEHAGNLFEFYTILCFKNLFFTVYFYETLAFHCFLEISRVRSNGVAPV